MKILVTDFQKLRYGIQQGILGPILFSIYVNNLLELEINGNILAFADDTVLFFEGQNWNEMETKANLGLSIVNKWYINKGIKDYSLSLNNSKSVFISFFLSNTNSPKQIILKSHLNKC